MTIELKAGVNDIGRRLDRVLRKALPQYSLSLIHRLLRQGKVLVNGRPAGPNERIRAGALIQIESDTGENPEPRPTSGKDSPNSASPTPPLPEILWRGSGIIVFNKPSGLATHGRASLDTLVNAFLAEKLPPSLSFRPGPLHRLDRPTSGIIAFSETLEGARLFSRLLRERKLKKTYLAIVEGRLESGGMWQDEIVRDKKLKKTFADSPRHGKAALTMAKALAVSPAHTLLELRISTGRTHQIRSQAAAHGHPLAGDTKYGGRPVPGGGFFLHAWKIEPETDASIPAGVFPGLITASLPEPFLLQIRRLFGDNIDL
jgi:23S rRNA pseudouridine955/2504/2580 synthase